MRVIVCCGAWMVVAAFPVHAQTFTVLDSLSSTQGAYARAGLAQGIDGNLYGAEGGGNFVATVLKITLEGAMTTLYTFSVPGNNFNARLVLATNGSLYGVTPLLNYRDESPMVYEIGTTGTLTFVATLCGYCEGAANEPVAGLIQGADGQFYGTTSGGGTDDLGTVFKMTPEGAITTLYSFCGESCDKSGWDPNGGLIQSVDGDFYGVTYEGGYDAVNGNGDGTVFKITASGVLTTIYRFCPYGVCADGYIPLSLVQGTDGNFYGTTLSGGVSPNSAGTVFKLTPSGTLTTLHSFCTESNCADGYHPKAGLIQATDGNFYGTTRNGGGTENYGTIFRITPDGTLTTLYDFCSQPGCADGAVPEVGLVQATSGDFYGVTSEGGTAGGLGTAFRLSVGLGPFVKTLPVTGAVGSTVEIVGNDLSAAIGVTFNGTPAVITSASKTVIVTAVPAGATSGPVEVVTPTGTLASNVVFHVAP